MPHLSTCTHTHAHVHVHVHVTAPYAMHLRAVHPHALPGDLTSGKEDARAKRKELIKMLEALIGTVEAQVKTFDSLRKASK